jgi:hypothetical protein
MTDCRCNEREEGRDSLPVSSALTERGSFGPDLRLRPEPFSSGELLTLTSALKLGAKIYEPVVRSGLSDRPCAPLMPHAVDLAIQLIGRGAPLHTVIAGLFYDVEQGAVRGSLEALDATIDRKFGAVAPGGKISTFIDGIGESWASGDSARFDRTERLAEQLITKVDPGKIRLTPYSEADIRLMSRGVWAAHNLFIDAKPRPWGPAEQLSMFRHAAEVGLLLIGAHQRAEIVTAGLMHDFYEGYVVTPTRGEIQSYVSDRFGGEIHRLLEAVTEPPKRPNHQNWWDRKLAVIRSLEEHDVGANTIVCAAKISTIAEGNKFLHKGGELQRWTSGSWDDNLRVFQTLRDLFEEKGVPRVLLERFDLELARWRSNAPTPIIGQ